MVWAELAGLHWPEGQRVAKVDEVMSLVLPHMQQIILDVKTYEQVRRKPCCLCSDPICCMNVQQTSRDAGLGAN